MNRVFAALFCAVFVIAIAVGCCFLFLKRGGSALSGEVSNEFCVIIDAGHGGEDGGASAADGTNEKDINLSIALSLEKMLSAAGVKTVTVRGGDSLIGDNSLSTIRERKVSDIKTRLKIAENNPNSLFVSVHQNHFTAEKYNGAQVFYSANSPESKVAAEFLQETIVGFLQPDNTREIKQSGSNIYILYNCKTPAVMVECGFLSNYAEAEKLKSPEYQTKMAFSIMCGILKYLE